MSAFPYDYTLIIPTFNRSQKLKTLISFLESQGFESPILIADSSEHFHRESNKALVQASPLTIDYQEFDISLSPFEKFREAVNKVQTAFCSLCADDDAIHPASIPKITSFLNQNPGYVAAHGYYYSFVITPQNKITDLCYRTPSNTDNDPLRRLEALFANYEAITYAIYHTTILQDILKRTQTLDTLLGNELLAGALTVAAGKVARLPFIYMGRSEEPSHPYLNWHPVEILASNPNKLYREYDQYRQILSDFILEKNNEFYPKDVLLKMIDFIHFSYISEFMTVPIMQYLLTQTRNRRSLPDTMQGLWYLIIAAQNKKLKEEKENINLLKLLKTFVYSCFVSIESKEFQKDSFLFEQLLVEKLTLLSPGNFNFYIADISAHMEAYKRQCKDS